jgi:hypothetical protein
MKNVHPALADVLDAIIRGRAESIYRNAPLTESILLEVRSVIYRRAAKFVENCGDTVDAVKLLDYVMGDQL